MGCSDGTCAITNVGIQQGEDVIMFECKSGRLYDLLGYVERFEQEYRSIVMDCQRAADRQAEKGGYPKEDITHLVTTAPCLAHLVAGIDIRRGGYDGYGWLEDVKRPDEPPPYFLVKAKIAEQITPLDDLWRAGEKIAAFMFDCRLPGFMSGPVGVQHVDGDEVAAHQRRITFINEALNDIMEGWEE